MHDNETDFSAGCAEPVLDACRQGTIGTYQANTLRAEPKARQVIKRSRWLLLRNRDNLKAKQAIKLEELLAANQPLATVYLLKTELKEIWYAPSVREGARRWKTWLKLFLESQIAPLIQFAKRLAKYRRGILASAIYPMSSSILEGVKQPHQGHQAHGLWLSGRILLLPENQGCVPR